MAVRARIPVRTEQCKTPIQLRLIAAVTCVAFLAGCATAPKLTGNPKEIAAAKTLAEARSTRKPAEQRAALYLQAAAMTAPMLGSGNQPTLARETYNEASAELTVLLRSDPTGKLWNHPLALTNGSAAYHLRLEPARYAVWNPSYFTSFLLPSQIKEQLIKKEITQAGVGGALVGVRPLLRAKTSRQRRESARPSRPPSILKGRTPLWLCGVRPNNRPPRWRGWFARWRPIFQRPSAISGHRAISLCWE